MINRYMCAYGTEFTKGINGHWCEWPEVEQVIAENQRLQERVRELEEALARNGIILEALNMSVDWELPDSVKQEIADACISTRKALAPDQPKAELQTKEGE